jgi:hypothetical protein
MMEYSSIYPTIAPFDAPPTNSHNALPYTNENCDGGCVKILSKSLMILGLLFVPCHGWAETGKYAEVIRLHEEFISIAETMANNLNKATNKEEVVKALDGYSSTLREIMPKMKAMAEKYPELRPQNINDVPPELKGIMAKAEKVGAKIATAMMKAREFDGPEVQQAMQRMAAASMGK